MINVFVKTKPNLPHVLPMSVRPYEKRNFIDDDFGNTLPLHMCKEIVFIVYERP